MVSWSLAVRGSSAIGHWSVKVSRVLFVECRIVGVVVQRPKVMGGETKDSC